MLKAFFYENIVWMIFTAAVAEISVTQIILHRKKKTFFLTRSKGIFILFIVQYMFWGILSLSFSSALQKIYLKVPLKPEGFVAPLIMGSLYGLLIGLLFFYVRKRNAHLEIAVSNARFNERRYKNLFDILPYGAEIMDLNGKILSVSENTCRFLGYDKDQLLGKNLKEFLHPDDQCILAEKLDRIKNPSRNRSNISEVRLLHSDGSCKTVLRSSSLVYDEQDRVSGILCVNTDITDYKEAEKEKQILTNRLVQTQRMEALGNLAGGIAHDFNNVLSPIIGFSELLMESLPQESSDHLKAEKIFQAGIKGKELTSQILDFSRQSELDKLPITVNEALKEILTLSKAVIPFNITLEEKITEAPCIVTAAPSHIQQIGMNLITNAIHAIDTGKGIISVSLENRPLRGEDAQSVRLPEGPYIELTVRDTGKGMEPAILEKIFEPYFTTKEKGKGTGMGLSIVYGIVKDLRGSIHLESQPGKGTTVKVFLPSEEHHNTIINGQAPRESARGHESILTIDEEDMITNYEKELLENLGYTVTASNSSREALEIFRSDPEKFDLVMSDINLHDISSLELTRELFKIRPEMPIILCSGQSDQVDRETLEHLGVDSILFKPATKAELSGKVRFVLDHPNRPPHS